MPAPVLNKQMPVFVWLSKFSLVVCYAGAELYASHGADTQHSRQQQSNDEQGNVYAKTGAR